MNVYPIFLVGLESRRCVVLGGNDEASRKIDGLLEIHARVVVVSTSITDSIRELVDADKVEWTARDYQNGDLRDAFLVVASGLEPRLRDAAFVEARDVGALINTVDEVEHCDFIAGAIVRRGALTVAISTGGRGPALAVRLRERFERELGPEYGDLLELMGRLRGTVAARVPEFERRREFWYRLVDSDILEQFRRSRAPRG